VTNIKTVLYKIVSKASRPMQASYINAHFISIHTMNREDVETIDGMEGKKSNELVTRRTKKNERARGSQIPYQLHG